MKLWLRRIHLGLALISGLFLLIVSLTGAVLIYAKDNDHLRSILYNKVHEIDGVGGTESFICFSTNFDRSVPCLK